MRKRDIVLLSTADWDHPFWTNKQHVAVELARLGLRILYIDSVGLRQPSVVGHDFARMRRRLVKALRSPRKVGDNIWVCAPLLIPLHRYRFIRRLNYRLLNRAVHQWIEQLGLERPLLWTYNPLTMDLLDVECFDGLVYHCVDEIRVQPGVPSDVIARSEDALVQRADVVFVTAPKLFESRRRLNARTYYYPNVADYEHFAQALLPHTRVPADIESLPRPRIGFVGAISEYKIDFELLEYVAQCRPHWTIVLIGRVGEGDPHTRVGRLKDLPNVHFLGPRDYAVLPFYLKGIDVAILPSRKNEYTESMFPMKFFEYLAAGRPVVSVDLPSLRHFSSVVRLAASYSEFVEGIECALQENGKLLHQRVAVARRHTYRTRTRKMWRVVEAVLTDRGRRG